MKNQAIIDKTIVYVKSAQEGEGTGHDWWHTERVWRVAKQIGKNETADMVVVELAALLHDIADFKFHGGDDEIGAKTAKKWLESLSLEPVLIEQVCEIVKNVSFKGANVTPPKLSIEGQIVQDADRLDALGAIGIARAFAYGGKSGREIHNPNYKLKMHDSFESYKNGVSTSLAHFYEKLLLLKDRMNTKMGKKMAESRHKFLENFLEEFYKEWEGKG